MLQYFVVVVAVVVCLCQCVLYFFFVAVCLIIMYTYHALINTLSVHMIPIKLNMIYSIHCLCVAFLFCCCFQVVFFTLLQSIISLKQAVSPKESQQYLKKIPCRLY